jgi:hypothetical protein
MNKFFFFFMGVVAMFLLDKALSYYAAPKLEYKRSLGIYTAQDILYVNMQTLSVGFENDETIHRFSTFESLNDFVEDYTAQAATIPGSRDAFDYYVGQGYVSAQVHAEIGADGKQISPVGKVDLYYNGPNYAYNPTKDTTLLLTTFDRVDVFNVEYDGESGRTYKMYQAYRID